MPATKMPVQAQTSADDIFAMPLSQDLTEKFGQLNLNLPINSDEEEKAQASIDSILGIMDSKPVSAAQVDTSHLFNFAGMETNKMDAVPGFGEALDASAEVNTKAAAQANSDDIFNFNM